MLRIPHCLDSLLIDGGKAVSPTHRPHFTAQKHYFLLIFPVDPVPDPLLLRKSASAGNPTQILESVARNSDHYTTEAVRIRFISRL
jgi:hypothetical protein